MFPQVLVEPVYEDFLVKKKGSFSLGTTLIGKKGLHKAPRCIGYFWSYTTDHLVSVTYSLFKQLLFVGSFAFGLWTKWSLFL